MSALERLKEIFRVFSEKYNLKVKRDQEAFLDINERLKKLEDRFKRSPEEGNDG